MEKIKEVRRYIKDIMVRVTGLFTKCYIWKI